MAEYYCRICNGWPIHAKGLCRACYDKKRFHEGKMRAWIMFTGEYPVDDGCLLVFADAPKKVKDAAKAEFGTSYAESRVWRCSGYDRFVSKFEPGVHVIRSNEECLEVGIPAYYTEVV